MPTALIVDDEPQANTLLAMLLQLRGFRTVSALTGRDAIEAVDREPFDVVFLDLMLPDINGFEVCTHIKTSKSLALTPVVMVTARITVENRVRSFLHGADEYVAKPYTPDQIYDALELAESRRRAAVNAACSGLIALDTSDEGETIRLLTQLRSILLAHTPLAPDEVARIGESLRVLWASAEAWGYRKGVARVASLAYDVHPDRLELRLHDLTGWLGEALSLSDDPAGRPDALASTCCDRVEVDDSLRWMLLVKQFGEGAGS